MEGKTVVITGGNSGIGKATAVAMARAGAKVVFTSRDATKGRAAHQDIVRASGRDAVRCLSLDLASFESVRRCAEQIDAECERIDVLVNNAGLYLSERTTTADGFEATFGVNHLGHFLLTKLLEDKVVASAPARIINLSSDAHRRALRGIDFDDLQAERRYDAFARYSQSKLANIYFTREHARRLEESRVTVNAVHPGTVATGFALDGDASGVVKWFFKLARPVLRTPEQGAATTIHVASHAEGGEVTGRYFRNSKQARPTRIASDDALAKKLWTVSEELIEKVS